MVSAVKACNVFHHFHHQTSPSTSSRISDITNFSLFSSKRESRLNLYTVSASAGERRNFSTVDAPVVALRRILNDSGIYLGPACFDALSAKLIERAGFDFCFTTGFGVSAARLGLPNTGYLSYGEMIDQGLQITEAVSIPVIGDGNNGFGNAMNIKRTIKGYIKAGFAGIILEDQEGNQEEKKVVSREEAVLRIKAAVDSRKESGLDIVIVARTDSRQAISLEESLWRSRAFADAGADVIFIDSLASKEEMKAFCEISPLVPKMANMSEGGGKTPLLSPFELEEIGFKIVAYPLSLLGVSIRAMQDALMGIKGGRIPPPGSMPTFEELKETLGFNAYYQEEKRYDMNLQKKTQEDPVVEVITPEVYNSYGADMNLQRTTQDPVVEVITPEVYDNYGADSSRESFSRVWSRKLRVKITGRDGSEKLDIRIPAGFLEGITNIVPALGGINIKALLDDASLEVGGKVLLDFNDSMGDRIQVFLE